MADYKYNTMSETMVEWTGRNGKTLAVKVALVQEMIDVHEQGNYTPRGLDITLTPMVDGRAEMQSTVQPLTQPAGVIVAKIGTIGLAAETVTKIKAAIAQTTQHPLWQAKLAAEVAAAKVDADYYQHSRVVDNMMSANGRSF